MLVTDIVAERQNLVNRISGNPGGAPLWFESSDIELRPSPEAFGSALLLPSLHNGSTLRIDSSVNRTWLSNLEHLVDVYHDWWGYPKLVPKALGSHNGRRMETGKTALFFSGGVDSFFSLLRDEPAIDALVTVYGFDITLQDGPRIAAFEASLSQIAAATGKESIIIRTNVREHPEFGKVFWERAHGGALAAIGHLLSDSFSRILISSSYPYAIDRPWGSHPKTDHLWSSDELKLVHFGGEFGRIDKLSSIVQEPLVRNHLRVCWENLTETGNCSRCEKCVRARLVLAECGELDNFPVFEGPELLAQQVDQLRQTAAYEPLYEQLVERGRLRADLDAAVRRLLKRSQSTERLPRRLAKRTVHKVLSMAGARRR